MLFSYLATGYYVNDCQNGIVTPVTGSGIFQSFLNKTDAESKAYCLAIDNAAYLRSFYPCYVDSTTTTSSTTSSTTTAPPIDLLASGNSFYSWTGDFNGESTANYDIVSWGETQGYLSGNTYGSNQYFSYLSANDINGYGVVLAVIKGSGLLTGFGSNIYNQLDIPVNLTGIIQVSVGYDHVLALKNDGTISGWGADRWGALNFNSNLNGIIVKKVCAGIGGSIFLIDSGIITGTVTIGGGQNIYYPNETGFINMDHYLAHVLAINSNGIITGFGSNTFGESNPRDLNGVSKISAGFSTSMAVYNDGYVTGYGTDQALYRVPSILNSGIDIQLRGHIGTILKRNEDIEQWIDPWGTEAMDIVKPDYIQNNVVAISQATHFTAAIFKRLTHVDTQIISGQNYLWEVMYVGGQSSYGGISLGDLYTGNATVIQSCDGYSFTLPSITNTGQSYSITQVPNCNVYAGTHEIDFNSIYSQPPLYNINYTKSGYAPKTGFAATGITINDYWNPVYYNTTGSYFAIRDSNNVLSSVSGLFINAGTGSGISFSHADNMYATAISGKGIILMNYFRYFPTGNYLINVYGHGPTSGQNSYITLMKNGAFIDIKQTSSGIYFDSPIFSGDNQYISSNFSINNANDYILVTVGSTNIITGGFLNGIQFIRY